MRHQASAWAMYRLLLATGVALPVSAMAQISDPATASDLPGATSENASSQFGSGEIVVTARRRAESLLETPVAVTALDARELERRLVEDLGDVSRTTPSLVFESTAGNATDARIFLRGVGNSNPANFQDPGVGVYIDGVYFGRSGGAFLDNVDIAQIEVLRGPQGTLFGRNTIGGAISITTQAPDSNEFSGSVSLGYGRFDEKRGRLAINVPVVQDLLAVRAAISYQKDDGFSVNDVDGRPHDNKDRLGGSLGIRLTPSDRLTFDFRGMYVRENGNGRGYQCETIPGSPPNALNGLLVGAYGSTYEAACAVNNNKLPRHFSSDVKTLARARVMSLSGTISYDVGEVGPFDQVDLKSITGLITQKSVRNIDFDGSPLPLIASFDVGGGIKTKTFSQEVQISAAIQDRLDFVAGGYYSDETTPKSAGYRYTFVYPLLDDIQPPPPRNIYQELGLNNRSLALYSQATFKLNDIVWLTGGLRYTKERKGLSILKYYARDDARTTPVPFLVGGVPFTFLVNDDFRKTYTDVSPLANIQLNLPDAALGNGIDEGMIYFTYSQGFKSGGFNGNGDRARANNVTSFEPERVDSYEIGLKAAAFDRRLRLSVAGYITKYKNIQQAVTGLNDEGAPVSTVKNAARATLKGAEVEAIVQPIEAIRFDGSVSYIDAQYDEFSDLVGGAVFDRSNEPFTFISKWQYSAGVEADIPLGDVGTLTPRIGVSGQSKRSLIQSISPLLRELGMEPGYVLLNAQVRWEVQPDLVVTVWGSNLTGEVYRNDALAGLSLVSYYGEPRRYGITVRKAF